MELTRLIDFLDKLSSSSVPINERAARGFDYALAGFRARAWHQLQAGQTISPERDIELMDKAVDLLMQATQAMRIKSGEAA